MLRALRGRLSEGCVIAGAVAPGVVGSDSSTLDGSLELDQGEDEEPVTALSICLIHLPPGSRLHAAYRQSGQDFAAAALDSASGGDPAGVGSLPAPGQAVGGGRRVWVVLSDTHNHIPGVLQFINTHYPEDMVVG